MNVDPLNGTGLPVENPGLPYYRFPANVSQSDPAQPHSNQDLAKFFARYDPAVNQLRVRWAADIMLVLTHQTYGEGAGFDWNQMNPDSWQAWIAGMANLSGQIAAHYKGKVRWYQIGNEHDKASEAAIYIPPLVYGDLFRRVVTAIRGSDPGAKFITAGMVSGAASGSSYLRQSGALSAADGVAFHAYGQDVAVNPSFGQFGEIGAFLQTARALGLPVHITEWGALDHEGRTSVESVAAYAERFLAACQGKVETAHWFAWGRQHNAFAVAPAPGQVRARLLNELQKTPRPGGGVAVPAIGGYRLIGIPSTLRFRTQPSLSGSVITLLENGDWIIPLDEQPVQVDGYRWRKISCGGDTGWIAVSGGGLSIGVLL